MAVIYGLKIDEPEVAKKTRKVINISLAILVQYRATCDANYAR